MKYLPRPYRAPRAFCPVDAANAFERTGGLAVFALPLLARVLRFAWLPVAVVLTAALVAVTAATTLVHRVIGQVCPPAQIRIAFGATTLTVDQLLLDVIGAFRKWFPALSFIGSDFRGKPLKLNQEYIAHIESLPTASTYDPTTGYANGANTSRSLLTDVPVTVDQHPTCPLKWLHLDEIKDVMQKYQNAIGNAGYVLAKGATDNVLTGVNTRNFSKETTIAIADFDYDALMTISGLLNTQQALPTGRVLLINTAAANILAVDARMISKDYAGQLLDGNGYRQWKNVGGFALIQEYPDLPSNNGSALTSVTAEADDDLITKTSHGLETGDPFVISAMTGGTGLSINTRYFAIRASANTFKAATTYANAVAGTGIDITADGSAMTVTKTENLYAFAFDKRAIAFLAGIPEGFRSELAAQLGVPMLMAMDAITDPTSGLSMGCAKWQAVGTGDLFVCPTFVYGKSLGRQGAAASTANVLTDYAGLRITTGATALP